MLINFKAMRHRFSVQIDIIETFCHVKLLYNYMSIVINHSGRHVNFFVTFLAMTISMKLNNKITEFSPCHIRTLKLNDRERFFAIRYHMIRCNHEKYVLSTVTDRMCC